MDLEDVSRCTGSSNTRSDQPAVALHTTASLPLTMTSSTTCMQLLPRLSTLQLPAAPHLNTPLPRFAAGVIPLSHGHPSLPGRSNYRTAPLARLPLNAGECVLVRLQPAANRECAFQIARATPSVRQHCSPCSAEQCVVCLPSWAKRSLVCGLPLFCTTCYDVYLLLVE